MSAYRILLEFDDGGPWWFRLLRYFWSGVFTSNGVRIYVKQEGDESPLILSGYVGDTEVTTKVHWKGSTQLVRRTDRP